MAVNEKPAAGEELPSPSQTSPDGSVSHGKVPPSADRKTFSHARPDGNALQAFLWKVTRPPPVPPERRHAGSQTSNLVSLFFFSWPFLIIWAATTRSLHVNDVDLIDRQRRAGLRSAEFVAHLERHAAAGSGHPLLRAVWSTWTRPLTIAFVAGLFHIHIDMGNVLLFRRLGLYLQAAFEQQAGNHEPWLGAVLTLGFAGIFFVSYVIRAHMLYQLQLVGGEVRTLLSSVMYAKAMRISPTAIRTSAAQTGGADGAQEGQGGGEGGEKKGGGGTTTAAAAKSAGSDVFWTDGPILHSMAVDTQRIESFFAWSFVAWNQPAALPGSLVLSWYLFGWPGIVTTASFLPTTAASYFVGTLVDRTRRCINRLNEKRATLVNDMLYGAQFLKMFAWEDIFLARFHALRHEEARRLVRLHVALVFLALFANQILRLTQVGTAALHRWFVGDLTDSYNVIAYTLLVYFNNQFAQRMTGNIQTIITGWPSLENVQDFLLAEERNPGETFAEATDPVVAVDLEDATFSWLGPAAARKQAVLERVHSRQGTGLESAVATVTGGGGGATADSATVADFTLAHLTLRIRRPELIAVAGPVGCGKSSLACGLVGEMPHVSGVVRCPQPSLVGYCPQTTWIQNASVRENITFGLPYEAAKFGRIVRACALERDLLEFPDGDLTELGERGITISGGQKARVQLARTLYRECDTVILDDPLSAVDARTSGHIFEHAIRGELLGRTVILVTHQLHVLGRCDRVVWMHRGAIVDVDTYDNLMEKHPEFVRFVGTSAEYLLTGSDEVAKGTEIGGKDAEKEEEEAIEKADGPEGPEGPDDGGDHKSPGVLMEAEEIATKPVPARLYLTYIRLGASLWYVALLFGSLAVSQGFNMAYFMATPWWSARQWSLPDWAYPVIMVIVILGNAVTWAIFWVEFRKAFVYASERMVREAIEAVFRAPMAFFDTTPLGRITNRFTLDVNFTDIDLTQHIWMVMLDLFAILSLVATIAVYVPISLSLFLPWALAMYGIIYLYRSCPLELRRLEATRSSLFVAKLQEGIHGRAALVACGRVPDFQVALHDIVDDLNSIHFTKFAVAAWSETRSNLVAGVLTFLIGVLTVQMRFTLAPAMALFSLSCAPQFNNYMTLMLESVAEVQKGMNSVERLQHYRTRLPDEGRRHVEGAVGKDWPTDGSIEIAGVDMRYREGLPLSVRGLVLSIRSGEKVGVVGRTGAGKSSLLKLLLRTVEAAAGSIRIGGIDIAHVGLHDLRRAIAIIPQDPTLFLGTLRYNLDPAVSDTVRDEAYDARMLRALRDVKLIDDGGGEKSSGETDGRVLTLESRVESRGRNFSSGHRQLVALARVLVRDARIILIDEATSNVDMERDAHVQSEIRRILADRTVIAIAHRVRTVLGYDRVVVMDEGRVAEVGTPRELYERKGGLFRDMCEVSKVKESDFA